MAKSYDAVVQYPGPWDSSTAGSRPKEQERIASPAFDCGIWQILYFVLVPKTPKYNLSTVYKYLFLYLRSKYL